MVEKNLFFFIWGWGWGVGHECLNQAEGGKIYGKETKVAGNTLRGCPCVEIMKQIDQRIRNN